MREKIIEFLELTQFYELAKSQLETVIENEVDPIVKNKLETNFNTEQLNDKIVPLYEKNITEDELNQILAFFKSPIGQKMIKINTDISVDVNDIMNNWFVEMYQKTLSEI
jgi:hypothetical protein